MTKSVLRPEGPTLEFFYASFRTFYTSETRGALVDGALYNLQNILRKNKLLVLFLATGRRLGILNKSSIKSTNAWEGWMLKFLIDQRITLALLPSDPLEDLPWVG